MKIISLLFLLLVLPFSAFGAEDTLIKLPARTAPPASLPTIEPGMTIVLPDGGRTIVEEILPNGDFRTREGQVVAPTGLILSGPNQGEHVVMEEAQTQPDGELKIPDKTTPSTTVEVPKVETPVAQKPALVETPKEQTAPATPKQPEWKRKALEEKEKKAPVAQDTTQKNPSPKAAAPDKTQPEHRITIAEMLPTTKVPEKKATAANEPEKAKEPEKARKKPEPPKKEEPKKQEVKKTEPKKPEVKKEEPKPVKQPEKKQAYEKPKVGQEMRIPPDAAAKGDLTFLEGCWQGTRPEYYSKRTIRECFCFGANGSGKRRVIDPQGHRMCIGSTRANLSKDGVLSVTSSGAACTDGARWGSAEMVCRNSGPKTPCSWIFRDANNGRQTYTIPFLRVESCGK